MEERRTEIGYGNEGQITYIINYKNDKLDGKQLYFKKRNYEKMHDSMIFHNLSDVSLLHMYDIFEKYGKNKNTLMKIPSLLIIDF